MKELADQSLRPDRWPSETPWSSAVPPLCHGEDQMQKEEEQKRCGSSVKGSPELGLSPPVLEGGNASNVSMVDDNLPSVTQMWLLRRRGKRAWTWMYLLALQPRTSKGGAYVRMLQGQGPLMTTAVTHQRRALTKTCPMTQTLMRMSYWGPSLTSLFPGDIWMTPSPSFFPQGKMTCNY